MTKEQARERAREWLEREGLAHTDSISEVEVTEELVISLSELLLSVASEAQQEERKRCEEIVSDGLAGLVASHSWLRGAWGEILRRIKGSE